jgi:hypothetical protein
MQSEAMTQIEPVTRGIQTVMDYLVSVSESKDAYRPLLQLQRKFKKPYLQAPDVAGRDLRHNKLKVAACHGSKRDFELLKPQNEVLRMRETLATTKLAVIRHRRAATYSRQVAADCVLGRPGVYCIGQDEIDL